MLDITFDKFKELPGLKNLTLKELSVLICGTERLYGFLSKLATHYPVAMAGNFKEVKEFVAKSGYNLILDNDYNNSLSIKDKRIKELEEELTYYKSLCACYINKLEAYRQVEEALKLLNEVTEEERLCKRPRHNRKRGNK